MKTTNDHRMPWIALHVFNRTQDFMARFKASFRWWYNSPEQYGRGCVCGRSTISLQSAPVAAAEKKLILCGTPNDIGLCGCSICREGAKQSGIKNKE